MSENLERWVLDDPASARWRMSSLKEEEVRYIFRLLITEVECNESVTASAILAKLTGESP